MRLKTITRLLNFDRLPRLHRLFKSSSIAYLATAGFFKKPVKLKMLNGDHMLIHRSDMSIWDSFFLQKDCSIIIEDGVFKITPDNNAHPPYYIAPGCDGFTFNAQRWNPACLKIPLVNKLQNAESRVYSQHGEDGVLIALFEAIPVQHKFLIEFGAHDGFKMSNSRHLIADHGWAGLLIEADKRFYSKLEALYLESNLVQTRHSFVTPENINQLFHQANAPVDFEFLSIDIDSIDYFVWEALSDFEPKVILVEYNSCLAPLECGGFTRKEALQKGAVAGAGLLEYEQLANSKGYQLIYTELSGGNAFFIHNSCKKYFPNTDWSQITVEKLFQPPQFGVLAGGRAINGRGYDYSQYRS